ncbi:MAG: hypothetical protein Q7R81_07855 [Candidatus Peregrinibacteria bacterium]|nr:hypothetical protein [Candidatus Peregrinibacteria bacterium]
MEKDPNELVKATVEMRDIAQKLEKEDPLAKTVHDMMYIDPDTGKGPLQDLVNIKFRLEQAMKAKIPAEIEKVTRELEAKVDEIESVFDAYDLTLGRKLRDQMWTAPAGRGTRAIRCVSDLQELLKDHNNRLGVEEKAAVGKEDTLRTSLAQERRELTERSVRFRALAGQRRASITELLVGEGHVGIPYPDTAEGVIPMRVPRLDAKTIADLEVTRKESLEGSASYISEFSKSVLSGQWTLEEFVDHQLFGNINATRETLEARQKEAEDINSNWETDKIPEKLTPIGPHIPVVGGVEIPNAMSVPWTQWASSLFIDKGRKHQLLEKLRVSLQLPENYFQLSPEDQRKALAECPKIKSVINNIEESQAFLLGPLLNTMKGDNSVLQLVSDPKNKQYAKTQNLRPGVKPEQPDWWPAMEEEDIRLATELQPLILERNNNEPDILARFKGVDSLGKPPEWWNGQGGRPTAEVVREKAKGASYEELMRIYHALMRRIERRADVTDTAILQHLTLPKGKEDADEKFHKEAKWIYERLLRRERQLEQLFEFQHRSFRMAVDRNMTQHFGLSDLHKGLAPDFALDIFLPYYFKYGAPAAFVLYSYKKIRHPIEFVGKWRAKGWSSALQPSYFQRALSAPVTYPAEILNLVRRGGQLGKWGWNRYLGGGGTPPKTPITPSGTPPSSGSTPPDAPGKVPREPPPTKPPPEPPPTKPNGPESASRAAREASIAEKNLQIEKLLSEQISKLKPVGQGGVMDRYLGALTELRALEEQATQLAAEGLPKCLKAAEEARIQLIEGVLQEKNILKAGQTLSAQERTFFLSLHNMDCRNIANIDAIGSSLRAYKGGKYANVTSTLIDLGALGKGKVLALDAEMVGDLVRGAGLSLKPGEQAIGLVARTAEGGRGMSAIVRTGEGATVVREIRVAEGAESVLKAAEAARGLKAGTVVAGGFAVLDAALLGIDIYGLIQQQELTKQANATLDKQLHTANMFEKPGEKGRYYLRRSDGKLDENVYVDVKAGKQLMADRDSIAAYKVGADVLALGGSVTLLFAQSGVGVPVALATGTVTVVLHVMYAKKDWEKSRDIIKELPPWIIAACGSKRFTGSSEETFTTSWFLDTFIKPESMSPQIAEKALFAIFSGKLADKEFQKQHPDAHRAIAVHFISSTQTDKFFNEDFKSVILNYMYGHAVLHGKSHLDNIKNGILNLEKTQIENLFTDAAEFYLLHVKEHRFITYQFLVADLKGKKELSVEQKQILTSLGIANNDPRLQVAMLEREVTKMGKEVVFSRTLEEDWKLGTLQANNKTSQRHAPWTRARLVSDGVYSMIGSIDPKKSVYMPDIFEKSIRPLINAEEREQLAKLEQEHKRQSDLDLSEGLANTGTPDAPHRGVMHQWYGKKRAPEYQESVLDPYKRFLALRYMSLLHQNPEGKHLVQGLPFSLSLDIDTSVLSGQYSSQRYKQSLATESSEVERLVKREENQSNEVLNARQQVLSCLSTDFKPETHTLLHQRIDINQKYTPLLRQNPDIVAKLPPEKLGEIEVLQSEMMSNLQKVNLYRLCLRQANLRGAQKVSEVQGLPSTFLDETRKLGGDYAQRERILTSKLGQATDALKAIEQAWNVMKGAEHSREVFEEFETDEQAKLREPMAVRVLRDVFPEAIVVFSGEFSENKVEEHAAALREISTRITVEASARADYSGQKVQWIHCAEQRMNIDGKERQGYFVTFEYSSEFFGKKKEERRIATMTAVESDDRELMFSPIRYQDWSIPRRGDVARQVASFEFDRREKEQMERDTKTDIVTISQENAEKLNKMTQGERLIRAMKQNAYFLDIGANTYATNIGGNIMLVRFGPNGRLQYKKVDIQSMAKNIPAEPRDKDAEEQERMVQQARLIVASFPRGKTQISNPLPVPELTEQEKNAAKTLESLPDNAGFGAWQEAENGLLPEEFRKIQALPFENNLQASVMLTLADFRVDNPTYEWLMRDLDSIVQRMKAMNPKFAFDPAKQELFLKAMREELTKMSEDKKQGNIKSITPDMASDLFTRLSGRALELSQ